jgi:hypothetical protein
MNAATLMLSLKVIGVDEMDCGKRSIDEEEYLKRRRLVFLRESINGQCLIFPAESVARHERSRLL